MFTGIVEETGRVVELKQNKNLCVLFVKVQKTLKGLKPGESVAVNGVCLTVTKLKRDILVFDVMKETILCTTLKGLRPGDKVNLERAMTARSRFGGHFVTGHIDGVGTLMTRITLPNYVELRIKSPSKLLKYIVEKGSVCLDGVSLTVGKVLKGCFSVYLIPYTLEVTTLGHLKAGDAVNIEADILARYVLNKR